MINSPNCSFVWRAATGRWAITTTQKNTTSVRVISTRSGFRADSRINEIIRSVATSSGPSVQLLDAQSLFAAESHNGVAGSELLYDHVHLTPPGNYILALAAYERIVNFLPPDIKAAASTNEPLSEVECERLLAFTGHDRARVAGEMVGRLQRPPFTNQLNHAEQVQSLMFRAAGATETPQDTLAQYQWAIAQAPDDLTLHYKFRFSCSTTIAWPPHNSSCWHDRTMTSPFFFLTARVSSKVRCPCRLKL